MKIYPQLIFWFLVLVYFSGTIGVLLHPSFFLPFTPYSLFFTSFVFLLFQEPAKNHRILSAFFGISLLGFFSEYLGLKTGWVFGNYHYGEVLGPKIASVPISISFNWALLVSASTLLVAQKIPHRLWASLVASLLITFLDLIIEQVAPVLDFWYFKEGYAGLHNYLGWFLVSFTGSFLFFNYLKKGHPLIARNILLLQFFFFGTLYIYNRLSS